MGWSREANAPVGQAAILRLGGAGVNGVYNAHTLASYAAHLKSGCGITRNLRPAIIAPLALAVLSAMLAIAHFSGPAQATHLTTTAAVSDACGSSCVDIALTLENDSSLNPVAHIRIDVAGFGVGLPPDPPSGWHSAGGAGCIGGSAGWRIEADSSADTLDVGEQVAIGTMRVDGTTGDPIGCGGVCPIVVTWSAHADDQSEIDNGTFELPCPPDVDGDGVTNADEGPCGADPFYSNIRPERVDGIFAGADDDGDTFIDEALPPGSESFDCDGDGWTGTQELWIFDVANTANDQDPCGNDGWPADLDPNNFLNIGDKNSYTVPARPDDGHGPFNKFFHTLDDDGDTVIDSDMARWNIDTVTGHTPTTAINIGDINALTAPLSSTAAPPMFGGEVAFLTDPDGAGPLLRGECPWPP